MEVKDVEHAVVVVLGGHLAQFVEVLADAEEALLKFIALLPMDDSATGLKLFHLLLTELHACFFDLFICVFLAFIRKFDDDV